MSGYHFRKSLLLLVLTTISQSGLSSQTGDTKSFDFRGTFFIQTPCEVNNDKVIDIAFGNVGINKVNGSNYSQSIPYTVTCNGISDGDSLHLTVVANQASYDQSTIVTSADGLGIQLLQNGQPMKINEPLDVSLDAMPELTAVPVKDPTKVLAEQTFNAAATLKADYE